MPEHGISSSRVLLPVDYRCRVHAFESFSSTFNENQQSSQFLLNRCRKHLSCLAEEILTLLSCLHPRQNESPNLFIQDMSQPQTLSSTSLAATNNDFGKVMNFAFSFIRKHF